MRIKNKRYMAGLIAGVVLISNIIPVSAEEGGSVEAKPEVAVENSQSEEVLVLETDVAVEILFAEPDSYMDYYEDGTGNDTIVDESVALEAGEMAVSEPLPTEEAYMADETEIPEEATAKNAGGLGTASEEVAIKDTSELESSVDIIEVQVLDREGEAEVLEEVTVKDVDELETVSEDDAIKDISELETPADMFEIQVSDVEGVLGESDVLRKATLKDADGLETASEEDDIKDASKLESPADIIEIQVSDREGEAEILDKVTVKDANGLETISEDTVIPKVLSVVSSLEDDNSENEIQTLSAANLPSADEIAGKYQSDPYKSVRPVYDVEPSKNSAGMDTGKLSQETLDEALKLVNLIRYTAGLPEVGLDEAYNEFAQSAAFINDLTNILNHTPSNPGMAGYTDEMYESAKEGCIKSNLGLGFLTLAESVLGYMYDGDSGNIDKLGHRRWVLDPVMEKIGFGQAGNGTAMYVVGAASNYEIEDYVAWPAENMPIEWMKPDAHTDYTNSYPWSVSLGSNYDTSQLGNVTVTLKKNGTDKSWNFNQGETTDKNHNYMNVNTEGYGRMDNCIIFRPDPKEITCANGDSFTVVVSGLIGADGQPTTLEYTVNMFSLNKEIGDNVPAPTPDGGNQGGSKPEPTLAPDGGNQGGSSSKPEPTLAPDGGSQGGSNSRPEPTLAPDGGSQGGNNLVPGGESKDDGQEENASASDNGNANNNSYDSENNSSTDYSSRDFAGINNNGNGNNTSRVINAGYDIKNGDGASDNSSDQAIGLAKDAEPKTGDATPIEIYATLAMVAGLSYLLLYFSDQEGGMTEDEKNEMVAALVRWGRKGSWLRKYTALAAILFLLVYYHSIGKCTSIEWKEVYGK